MTLLIAFGALSVLFSIVAYVSIGSLLFYVFKALFKGDFEDVFDSIFNGGPRFVIGWISSALASLAWSAFVITAIVLVIIAIL